MSTFAEGADVELLGQNAQRLTDFAATVDRVTGALDRTIGDLRVDWGGADFGKLAGSYAGTVAPALLELRSTLTTMSTRVRSNASEQQRASGESGRSGGPGGGETDQGGATITISRDGVDLTLTEGTFFDKSAALHHTSGENYDVQIGSVSATSGYEVGVSKDGTLSAGVSASASAYLLNASGHVGSGPFSAEGKFTAGASSSADAGLGIGPDGVSAGVKAEAFAGVRAGVDGSVEVGGVRGTAGVEGYAGVGGTFAADVTAKGGKVHIGVDAGVSLLLGGRVHGEVTIDVNEVGKNISSFADGAGKATVEAAHAVGKATGDAMNAVGKATGDFVSNLNPSRWHF